MENQITCPQCKKTIVISAMISAEAKGEGTFARRLVCDCGEKIPYWGIASQLQNHQKLGWKFRNWIRSLSHNET